MNIWYIHPYAGGPNIGRYWRPFHLCKAWAKQGHSAAVITSSFHHLMDHNVDKFSCVQQVPYHYVPTTRYSTNGFGRLFSMMVFSILLIFKGLKLAKRNKPDLIIYSSAHPFGYFSAWLLSRFYRCQLFFEVRDIWPLSLIEVAKINKFHPLVIVTGLIERFAYKTSSSVISLLPGAREHMISKGMEASKFIYAPNGFSSEPGYASHNDTEMSVLDELRAFKARGFFLFVYTGALGEPNAMHRFLDCLQYFNLPSDKQCKFIIIGKGEQSESLKKRCVTEGYEHVLFYEQIGKTAILEVLALADVGFFVMHNLPIYRFGVSLNKLFDYMSSGLPVVAAFDAYNDPVSQANCGVRVQPDDPESLASAFQHLIEMSPSELITLGMNGSCYIRSEHEYSVLAKKIINNF